MSINAAFRLPFLEAIAFFRGKTNIPTEHWDDLWALESIKQARALEADSDEIEQRYADILAKQNKHEEALNILRPMLDRDEPAFAAVMNFAQFASDMGRKDEAEALLEKLKQSDELTDIQKEHVTQAQAQLKTH